MSNYYVDATGKEFKPEDAVNGKMKQDANGYGWVTKRPQELEDGENPEYWLQPGGNERYPVL